MATCIVGDRVKVVRNRDQDFLNHKGVVADIKQVKRSKGMLGTVTVGTAIYITIDTDERGKKVRPFRICTGYDNLIVI